MQENKIIKNDILDFKKYLINMERSARTIDKYCRDVAAFIQYLSPGEMVTREKVIEYKGYLQGSYKVSSANSMLAALNCFFHYKNWDRYRVSQFKVQRHLMGGEERRLTKEEYARLVTTALYLDNQRLAMIMETIGNTGIRISELPFITVEALDAGRVEIYNKGKFRTIFLIEKLRCRLRGYCRENGLTSGPVFVTSGGMAVNRSNIWAEMKRLCIKAGIPEQKVFPHNLRHLFAYTYYGVDKDLVHLADILGHSSVETTRIYTISTGEEQQEVMQKMEMII